MHTNPFHQAQWACKQNEDRIHILFLVNALFLDFVRVTFWLELLSVRILTYLCTYFSFLLVVIRLAGIFDICHGVNIFY